MIWFMLAGALIAVALVHGYRLAVPPRTDLVAGVGRWDQARARASRVQQLSAPPATTWTQRLVERIAEQVTRRDSRLPHLGQDLAAAGIRLEEHLSRLLALVGAGFLGPIVIVGLGDGMGVGLPLSAGVAIGLGLAAAMVLVAHRELIEKARRRRAEFRRTLSIYLDLVAMSLQAGRGHAEALPAAAAIGTGWGFTEIRDAIEGARFSGITPWVALGRLGARIGVPELCDLEGALELANEDGAKVRATLVARATTLRDQRVADAEADANRATESMKFALIAMVFVFLSYELYPSVARLFSG
ncbi:hypothetical protein [Nocardioides terrisoli]|uniref:hypothetical protein n=1 Tax=Nocardioides terrisoli TaxID=3388267 RepID=UPI00287B7DD4|nr:hypothetical protein [Nocardioides marmorisolisilvae]